MFGILFTMTTAGGRASARRRLACWLAAAAIVLAGPAAAFAASDPADDGDRNERVTVEERDGLYTIAARFTVPVSPDVVLAVLTDYDTIPKFLPNVQSSRLLERTDGHVLVEQQAIVKLMFFSTRIHLLLGIDEEPGSLRFVDRSGKSFERYEGAWTVTARGDGAAVSYTLAAKPSFEAPGFIVRRLMRRDASDQIERLQKEMLARADAARR